MSRSKKSRSGRSRRGSFAEEQPPDVTRVENPLLGVDVKALIMVSKAEAEAEEAKGVRIDPNAGRKSAAETLRSLFTRSNDSEGRSRQPLRKSSSNRERSRSRSRSRSKSRSRSSSLSSGSLFIHKSMGEHPLMESPNAVGEFEKHQRRSDELEIDVAMKSQDAVDELKKIMTSNASSKDGSPRSRLGSVDLSDVDLGTVFAKSGSEGDLRSRRPTPYSSSDEEDEGEEDEVVDRSAFFIKRNSFPEESRRKEFVTIKRQHERVRVKLGREDTKVGRKNDNFVAIRRRTASPTPFKKHHQRRNHLLHRAVLRSCEDLSASIRKVRLRKEYRAARRTRSHSMPNLYASAARKQVHRRRNSNESSGVDTVAPLDASEETSVQVEETNRFKLQVLTRAGTDVENMPFLVAEMRRLREAARSAQQRELIDGVLVSKTAQGLLVISQGTPRDIVRLMCSWLSDESMRPENDPEGTAFVEDQVRAFCIGFPKLGVSLAEVLGWVQEMYANPRMAVGAVDFVLFLDSVINFNSEREEDSRLLEQFVVNTLTQSDQKYTIRKRSACALVARSAPDYKAHALKHKRSMSKPMSMFDFRRDAEDITYDNCSPTEIAEMMTLVDHEMLVRIPLHDFLHRMWERSKWEGHAQAPRVFYAVKRWVKVCNWCASFIVREKKTSRRHKAISWLIAMATELRRLGNFQSLTAVISSFNGAAISRLKRTWSSLKDADKRREYALDELCQPMRHYHNYRAELEARLEQEEPCIPFMGMATQELTTLDEAESDWEDGARTQVNFEKIRFVGKIIGQLHTALRIKSPFVTRVFEENTRQHRIKQLVKFLPNTLQAELIYQRSLKIEPPAIYREDSDSTSMSSA